jgi:hypothetical protein
MNGSIHSRKKKERVATHPFSAGVYCMPPQQPIFCFQFFLGPELCRAWALFRCSSRALDLAKVATVLV